MNKFAFASLAGVAALIAAPGAAQENEHPNAQQVAEAIAACQLITEHDWIHLDRLDSVRFYAVERRGSGRKKARVRGLYQKRGNPSYIILSREELSDKRCVVSASLPDTGAYGRLAQEVSGIIGMPTGQDGFAYLWELDDQRLRVEPEGDQDEPFARFTLTATAEDGVPSAPEAAAE